MDVISAKAVRIGKARNRLPQGDWICRPIGGSIHHFFAHRESPLEGHFKLFHSAFWGSRIL